MQEVANTVICAICKMEIPLSCALIDKGVMFPEILRDEHVKHEIYVCYNCASRTHRLNN